MFIETWTMPREASGSPRARTPGRPAVALAHGTGDGLGDLEAAGLEVDVEREQRSAHAEHDRAGARCGARGRLGEQRARCHALGERLEAAAPELVGSAPPPESAYRKTGRPSAASPSASSSTSRCACSCNASSRGTTGTMSSAPMCGWTPVFARTSIRSIATMAAAISPCRRPPAEPQVVKTERL